MSFRFLLLILLIQTSFFGEAQTDSVIQSLQQVLLKYIHKADSKMEKYNNRIVGKTEKTLKKISHWETKVKPLLQRDNPAAAERLLGEGKPTITSLLQQAKERKLVAENYRINQYLFAVPAISPTSIYSPMSGL